MSTAYKETRDEFEDPELETRRIYISKLFSGLADWRLSHLTTKYKVSHIDFHVVDIYYPNHRIITEKRRLYG